VWTLVYRPIRGPWLASVRAAALLPPVLKRLGDRIREQRTAKDWTQEDSAAECGLDRSYVSRLEVGRRIPRTLNLIRIAKTLNMTLTRFLEFPSSRFYLATDNTKGRILRVAPKK
jgi:transcriptional regulator with XRE-family HTH domain